MTNVNITTDQLAAYIQAATLLVTFGGVAVERIRAMFGALPGLSREQLDAICDAVEADARRRKALSDAEAGTTTD